MSHTRLSFEDQAISPHRDSTSDAPSIAPRLSLPPHDELNPDILMPHPSLSPQSPSFNVPGAFPPAPRVAFARGSQTSSATHSSSGMLKSSKRNPTRIIRTFEEVEVAVEKTIMAEEWYEELECGICAHILGAPQALVPCGHSFCGVCAWQWIKAGKNYTCPHCRMEVFEATPIVPNIIVDQIIERKLRSLPDGKQKTELLIERKEKAESWKAIQASIAPVKPARRSRGFGVDDILGAVFTTNEQVEASRRRRASRSFAELGAPLGMAGHGLAPPSPRRTYGAQYGSGNMTLGDIRRMEAENDALSARLEARRLREALYRTDQSLGLGLESLTEEPMDIHHHEPSHPQGVRDSRLDYFIGQGQGGARTRASTGPSTQRSARSSTPGSSAPPQPASSDTPVPPTSTQQHGRPTPLRSSALAARQARGRNRGASRDHPLVVLSDSEEE